MQSILATGGTFKKRKEYIYNQLDKLRIWKFNQIHITAQNSVTIDQVRYLISKLHIKPVADRARHARQQSWRAGIILEAEKATIEAQNALLKLLEEPPKTARLFLSAPNPKHLLPTIVSRCKVVRLKTEASGISPHAQEFETVVAQLATKSSSSWLAGSKKIIASFQLAEKYGQNRETADEFLKNLLSHTRQRYINRTHHTLPITHYAQLARKIQLSRRFIAANVNPRQVLENLLLNF
jgi:DNA polymerase III gamma/tau subunit